MTETALPASPGVLAVNNRYYDYTAATQDITLPASATAGDLIELHLVCAAETTLTFLTTLPYRVGFTSTASSVTFPIGNNQAWIRYVNGQWNLTDTGNGAEATETDTWIIAASDETTDLTASNGKVQFLAPYAATITGVRASVTTAPVGATLTVDINDGGTSIMTTNKLDILTTATVDDATAAITDTAVAQWAVITVDVDTVGSTTAGAGLKVYITHTH